MNVRELLILKCQPPPLPSPQGGGVGGAGLGGGDGWHFRLGTSIHIKVDKVEV